MSKGKTKSKNEKKEEPKIEDEERLTPTDEENEEKTSKVSSSKVSIETDYLRKYQFKKERVLGSPSTDPDNGSKAERMKKNLLSQPKIRMIIPVEPKESPNIRKSVTLNGYRLDFPKNTYIDVPEQIAEVLRVSLQQTEQALAMNRIDGNTGKENALL